MLSAVFGRYWFICLVLALHFPLTKGFSAPAFAAQPGPPSDSKISIHLIGNYTAGAQKIVQARPRVLKILDTHSSMLQAAREYKQLVPDGIVVLRIYTPVYYPVTDNPVTAANNYWNQWLRPRLDSLSASDRALIDYLEGPNEGDNTPTWVTLADTEWYNTFWMTLAPLMANAGFKPNAYSISVGNPPGSPQEIYQRLDRIAPSLKLIKSLGGSWGYHSYTIQYTTNPGIEYWYSLRYRMFYNYFAQAHPELVDLPIILTEGGVDGQVSPLGAGWKGGGDAAKYINWLQWFDTEIRKDPQVVGVTLFQSGDFGMWLSFEVEPISDWLAQHLKSSVSVPFLTVEPAATSATGVTGLNAASQTIKVRNTGAGNMAYNITSNAGWIQVEPSAGVVSAGGEHNVTLKFKSSSLPVGTYNGQITVTAPGATGSPQNIAVQLIVKAGTTFGQPTINQIKRAVDTNPILIRNKVVTTDIAGTGSYYIQEANRSAGILLQSPSVALAAGDLVDVLGTMSTRYVNGIAVERQIIAYEPNGVQKVGKVELPPAFGMNLETVGGGALNHLTPGVPGGVGLHNIGLLVRTTGWVRSASGGVAVLGLTPTGASEPTVHVSYPQGVNIPVGKMVQVRGVTTGYVPSGGILPHRHIYVRTPLDVQVLN